MNQDRIDLNADHSHADHQPHPIEEILGAMSARIKHLEHHLEIARVHTVISKLALQKLLPNIGDSVTINASVIQITNDNDESANTITFFRDEAGELDMKAD